VAHRPDRDLADRTWPPARDVLATPLGEELADTVGVLVGWVARRIDEILVARRRYDEA
jgi:DNA-binding HxlR family transcriptional regulator